MISSSEIERTASLITSELFIRIYLLGNRGAKISIHQYFQRVGPAVGKTPALIEEETTRIVPREQIQEDNGAHLHFQPTQNPYQT